MEMIEDDNQSMIDQDLPREEPTVARKILSVLIRAVISTALVVWIFGSIDWGIFKQIVVSPKPYPLAAFIAFSLFFVFLGGLKLWILLRSFHPMSLWRFSANYFLASSVGSLIPSIFGDFTLAALMKKSCMDYHKSFSIIILDRLITLLLAVFVFTPFTLIFVLPGYMETIFTLTAVALVSTVVAIWLSTSFFPLLFNRFSATKQFWEATIIFFQRDRMSLWWNVLIGIFRGVISGVALAFALVAANLNPALFPTICIANSLAIVTHIPVSISGLGIYEGGGLILFESIGMQREMVLAGLFYQRAYILVWSLVTILVLGSVLLLRRHRAGNAHSRKTLSYERELPP